MKEHFTFDGKDGDRRNCSTQSSDFAGHNMLYRHSSYLHLTHLLPIDSFRVEQLHRPKKF